MVDVYVVVANRILRQSQVKWSQHSWNVNSMKANFPFNKFARFSRYFCYWSESLRSKLSEDEIDEFVVKGFTPWKLTNGWNQKKEGWKMIPFPKYWFPISMVLVGYFPPPYSSSIYRGPDLGNDHISRPKGKARKSSTQKCLFGMGICDRSPTGYHLLVPRSQVCSYHQHIPGWLPSPEFRGPQPFVFPKFQPTS